MLMVLEGKRRGAKRDRWNTPQLLAAVEAGRTLGEMSMIDGEPRFATCVAAEPALIAVLDRESLARIIVEQPLLGAKILMELVLMLSQRLRATSQRLLGLLDEQAQRDGRTCSEVSRARLARRALVAARHRRVSSPLGGHALLQLRQPQGAAGRARRPVRSRTRWQTGARFLRALRRGHRAVAARRGDPDARRPARSSACCGARCIVSFASTHRRDARLPRLALPAARLGAGALRRAGCRPINEGVAKDGAFYLFALRLVPAFPFFLINLLMGLTPIRAWTFYWVSQVGMLAGTSST